MVFSRDPEGCGYALGYAETAWRSRFMAHSTLRHTDRPRPDDKRGLVAQKPERDMGIGTILLILLILLLVGALPAWPYSTGWGYWPSGGLGLIVLIVALLVVLGRI